LNRKQSCRQPLEGCRSWAEELSSCGVVAWQQQAVFALRVFDQQTTSGESPPKAELELEFETEPEDSARAPPSLDPESPESQRASLRVLPGARSHTAPPPAKIRRKY